MPVIVGDNIVTTRKGAVNIDGDYGPYETVDAAVRALVANKLFVAGRTVGIKAGVSVVEYWVQPNGEGVLHLVEKNTDIGVSAYTKEEIDKKLSNVAKKSEVDSIAATNEALVSDIAKISDKMDAVTTGKNYGYYPNLSTFANAIAGMGEELMDGHAYVGNGQENTFEIYVISRDGEQKYSGTGATVTVNTGGALRWETNKDGTYSLYAGGSKIEGDIAGGQELSGVAERVVGYTETKSGVGMSVIDGYVKSNGEFGMSEYAKYAKIALPQGAKTLTFLGVSAGTSYSSGYAFYDEQMVCREGWAHGWEISQYVNAREYTVEIPEEARYACITAVVKSGSNIVITTDMGIVGTNANTKMFFFSVDQDVDIKGKIGAISQLSGNRNGESGMAYIIIDQDADISAAMTEPAIYDIRYDYDLGGKVLNVPSGSVLRFNGGSIRNGGLAGNGFTIEESYNVILPNIVFDKDIKVYGTFTLDNFGAKGDGVTDDSEAFKLAINNCNYSRSVIRIPNGKNYLISNGVEYGDTTTTTFRINIRGEYPSNYSSPDSNRGGFVLDNTWLFKRAYEKCTLYGSIENIGVRSKSHASFSDYENVNVFYKVEAKHLTIKGCVMQYLNSVFCDCKLQNVCQILNNTFMQTKYFATRDTWEVLSFVDSVLDGNYINGGKGHTDNYCFGWNEGDGSVVSNNFIDYYRTIFYAENRGESGHFVKWPQSMHNQYQVFLYLYTTAWEPNDYPASFISVGDRIEWTDTARLNAERNDNTLDVFVPISGIQPCTALMRGAYNVHISGLILGRTATNPLYMADGITAKSYARFDVSFVQEARNVSVHSTFNLNDVVADTISNSGVYKNVCSVSGVKIAADTMPTKVLPNGLRFWVGDAEFVVEGGVPVKIGGNMEGNIVNIDWEQGHFSNGVKGPSTAPIYSERVRTVSYISNAIASIKSSGGIVFAVLRYDIKGNYIGSSALSTEYDSFDHSQYKYNVYARMAADYKDITPEDVNGVVVGYTKKPEKETSPYERDVRVGNVPLPNLVLTEGDFSWGASWQTASSILTKYDSLLGGYITKVDIGTASDGSTMYVYKTNPVAPIVSKGVIPHYRPKVIVVCGQHGFEKNSIFSMYYLLKALNENWMDSPVLTYLRHNVEILVVPCANPYGITNGVYKNANGVNLNRNWPIEHWSADVSDTSDSNYQGASALDQPETYNIHNNVILPNKDALFAIDYHTQGSGIIQGVTNVATPSQNLNWLSMVVKAGDKHAEDWVMGCHYHLANMSAIASRKYAEKLDGDANEPRGRMDVTSKVNWDGTVGYLDTYFWENGIMGVTFEGNCGLPLDSSSFSEDSKKFCTEAIANFIITQLSFYNN